MFDLKKKCDAEENFKILNEKEKERERDYEIEILNWRCLNVQPQLQ